MATNMVMTCRKLINALNSKGFMLTFNVKEFMGIEGLTHKYYVLSQAVWNDQRNRYDNNDLYGTISVIRMVRYLRDMWYDYNGWELPMDQPKWNKIREELRAKNG